MSISKFHNIYHDICQQIKMDKYQQDSFLPSENQLSIIYAVSRETVRKALNLLQMHGYITKVRGKGSKVILQDTVNFKLSKLASFSELNHELGLKYVTKVIALEYESLEKLPIIRENLLMESQDSVIKVIRQRIIDNKINIVDIDYFNPKIITGLTQEIAEHSIYNYIENQLGLTISYANKTITFNHEDESIVKMFGKLEPAYSATVSATIYLQDGCPFQYNISKHRPELFKFIDFSRRTL